MVHIQALSSFQPHSSPFTPSPYPLRYPLIFSSFLTWISQPFFLLPVDYVLLLGAGNPDHYRNCSLHLSVWQHWQHRLLMLHEERQQADHTSKDWKIKTQPISLVQQDIFQYLSLEHALDEDEDVDENVSNLVFIQDSQQIIERVKFFSFYFILCMFLHKMY